MCYLKVYVVYSVAQFGPEALLPVRMKLLLNVPFKVFFWKCLISRLQMKESTNVWLRVRLEQQRGPSLSKFRVSSSKLSNRV